jgi:hypothetical protein
MTNSTSTARFATAACSIEFKHGGKLSALSRVQTMIDIWGIAKNQYIHLTERIISPSHLIIFVLSHLEQPRAAW